MEIDQHKINLLFLFNLMVIGLEELIYFIHPKNIHHLINNLINIKVNDIFF